ncbi:hypothetical protein CN582_25265 [Bacillus wiedmannii]|uniref:ABC transporter permease n=1 Tax=Bacillus wiedmannii TaxID=1890302 RepID=UPI000BF9F0DA|nr:ABC-2 family transporter protein [Bacillus wiedmannii]PEP92452.1 hypothetical protein CN582_25265 [Bacillus wiedmannii]
MRYLVFAKLGIKQQMAYKSDLWLNVLGMMIAFVLWIFFWKGIYQGEEKINGISINQMINYMAISYALLIPQLHNMRMRHSLNEKVRSGNIIFDLIRPGNFILKIFFERIGVMAIFFLFLVFPIYGVMTAVISDYQVDTYRFILFLLMSIVSIIIGFLININFCILMFRFVETSGTWVIFNALTFFFGGMPFPIWIYPEKVQVIISFLPFKYLYYVPTSIYNGTIVRERIFSEVYIGVAWILILFIVSIILWRKLLKKIILQGG